MWAWKDSKFIKRQIKQGKTTTIYLRTFETERDKIYLKVRLKKWQYFKMIKLN